MNSTFTALSSWRRCRFAAVVLAVLGAASCSGEDAGSPAAPAPSAALAAPTAKSPVAGVQTQSLRPALEVNNAAATGSVGTVTYRFELSELPDFPVGSRSVAIDSVPQGAGTTSTLVPVELIPGKLYYWHARARNGTITTSYSTTESFRADDRGFINGQTIVDPLTNGQTVAHERHGGHFESGPNGGWQADGPGDSLDYNIPTCSSCAVEFDVTNFASFTAPEEVDAKWLSMGDGSAFGSHPAFTGHPWKMSIEKRSGDGGAVKLIWRRGCNDDISCDNTNDTRVGISWDPSKVYHFTVQWGANAMSVNVCEYNGTSCIATVYSATGSGTYAPPNHRIELGNRPRNETLIGARFRNFKVNPR